MMSRSGANTTVTPEPQATPPARVPSRRAARSDSSFILHPSSFRHPALAIALGIWLVAAGGCLQRRMHITSDPPGATAWVNGVEVGQTPVEAEFTWYGTYDIRLHREGYEPVAVSKWAVMPWYEVPPIDFFAMALPWNVRTTVKWDFALEPAPDLVGPEADAAREELLQRAEQLRGRASP